MSDQPQPAAALTPEQLVLQKDVGTWDADAVFRIPGQPEQAWRGVRESRLIAGGKWLVSDFRADTGFEGHGVIGWDPLARKYWGTWVDSASPAAHRLEGEWDEGRSVMTMMAETPTPDGRTFRMRQATECPSPTRQVFRSFIALPEGEHEIMTITYTRR